MHIWSIDVRRVDREINRYDALVPLVARIMQLRPFHCGAHAIVHGKVVHHLSFHADRASTNPLPGVSHELPQSTRSSPARTRSERPQFTTRLALAIVMATFAAVEALCPRQSA